jgi:hypothetical protein
MQIPFLAFSNLAPSSTSLQRDLWNISAALIRTALHGGPFSEIFYKSGINKQIYIPT